jgi:hypothetical protein
VLSVADTRDGKKDTVERSRDVAKLPKAIVNKIECLYAC